MQAPSFIQGWSLHVKETKLQEEVLQTIDQTVTKRVYMGLGSCVGCLSAQDISVCTWFNELCGHCWFSYMTHAMVVCSLPTTLAVHLMVTLGSLAVPNKQSGRPFSMEVLMRLAPLLVWSWRWMQRLEEWSDSGESFDLVSPVPILSQWRWRHTRQFSKTPSTLWLKISN